MVENKGANVSPFAAWQLRYNGVGDCMCVGPDNSGVQHGIEQVYQDGQLSAVGRSFEFLRSVEPEEWNFCYAITQGGFRDLAVLASIRELPSLLGLTVRTYESKNYFEYREFWQSLMLV